jgi:hypothetical protein
MELARCNTRSLTSFALACSAEKAHSNLAQTITQASRLLKSSLRKELHATPSEGTLFRGVSVATRLVSHYMRLRGREFLEATLTHFFETLLPKDIQIEVDPNRSSAVSVSDGCVVLASWLQPFFIWTCRSDFRA